jgi:GT2 family glycosyltransferase
MDWPSDALVICTRNRIDDVKRCLASVEAARYVPGRILVVDSSDGRETEEYCAQSDVPITYIRAPRGLTIQRNIALAEVREEIVHFVDDDVEVEPDYFRELIQVLRDSPHAAGVGGAMAGAGASRPALIQRLILKSSLRPGLVLRSGYNTGCYNSPNPINVDWLPGCSMSFRMSAICGLKFDERRKGYAPGEDVDFGLKALERGPLLYTPTARLTHHLSPTNRADLPEMVRASVHSRWILAVDFPHRVSRGHVVYSSLAEGLILAVKSIKRGRALQRRMAVAAFAGVVDVLRDGANVNL